MNVFFPRLQASTPVIATECACILHADKMLFFRNIAQLAVFLSSILNSLSLHAQRSRHKQFAVTHSIVT